MRLRYFYMDLIKELSRIKESFSEPVEIIDGLFHDPQDIVKKIEYYTNSAYLNGNRDEFNREKFFYNIINYRVNVATRATDFDTKDIQIFSENPNHFIKSMIFGKEVKKWMRKTGFGKTINDFSFTRAKYGGVLAKKVIKDGELKVEIPEWKNVYFDPIDIVNGTKIEKHYLTPVQLSKKKDVWNQYEENIDKIEKILRSVYGKNYSNSDRVCVLEVEGEFPETYIDEKGDEDNYTLQKHFVLADGEEKPICTLHSMAQKKTDYKYLPWLEASGRSLGIGIAEDGFQAQMATNDSMLKWQDIMEIAARPFIVSDSDVLQNNIVNDMVFGDIMRVEKGSQTNLLNLTPPSLVELRNITQQWDEQYSRATSTFEAITGETMPSGTPFRAIAVQNQEAQSMFLYRREEADLFWREVFTDWVLPHIKSKLTREHILSSDFTIDELMMIDEAFAINKANKKVIEKAIQGKVMTQEDYDKELEAQKLILQQTGEKRFIQVPNDYFKDAEFDVDILITGEQLNKSATFESISNILATVGANPTILQDPIMNKLFAKVIELAGVGISPTEITNALNKQTQQLDNPEQVQLQEQAQTEQPVA